MFALALLAWTATTHAGVLYRCERDGTMSMSTAPEPRSRCIPITVSDNASVLTGSLYRRLQNGETVYSTRYLPGSLPVSSYSSTPLPDISLPPELDDLLPLPADTAARPAYAVAHAGLGRLGRPQVRIHSDLFVSAARDNGIDDAWLRAIAHVESGFRADAVSPKGAQGIMQLMPATSVVYRVDDPFSPGQSIRAGAKYLAGLLRRFKGDRRLAAAAYNAGVGAVARYSGVPPYAETQNYVDKVDALFRLYQAALPTGNMRRKDRAAR